MGVNKGKLILKSENVRSSWRTIVLLGFLTSLFLLGGIVSLINVVLLIISKSNLHYLIFFLILFLFSLPINIFLVLFLLSEFIPALIIYENGIGIRKILFRKQISYKDVLDAEIKKGYIIPSKKHFLIYFQNRNPFIIEGGEILNYKKALSLILKNKKGIGTKTKLITLRKHRYDSSGIIQISCNGTGTKNDPILIDNTIDLPRNFYIKNYKLYILIKNIHKRFIGLEGCQNISFKDSKFKYINLNSCSDIEIKNLTTKYTLLDNCQKILLENSVLRRIKLYKSLHNIIKNCEILRLKESASKSNDYITNNIQLFESSVKKETLFNRNSLVKNQTQEIRTSVRNKKTFSEKHSNLTITIILILMIGPLFPSLIIGLLLEQEEARQIVGLLSFYYYLIFFVGLILWISIIGEIQKRTLS